MSSVDVSQSHFHEIVTAPDEFNRVELRRLRLLLRRLRFLEKQIRNNGGMGSEAANGGAAFVEWEVEALEWILTDIGYLVVA